MKKIKIAVAILVSVLVIILMINGLINENMPKTQNEVQITTQTIVDNTNTNETTKTAKKVVKPRKKKTTKKVVKRVSGFNVKASKSEMQQYARSILNEKDYQALDIIITRESGWNANNVNKKSGASGLCQSLPASKMAISGKDYKTNYKTQINWCILYCNTRYGSIQKAKKFWLKHHWF